MSYRRSALALVLIGIASTPPAAAEGVQIANGQGGPTYPDVQAAVDAALDGDVIVVGAGLYPGFTIAGKGMSVQALPGHAVELAGPIEVLGLPLDSTVVLAGLRTTGGPGDSLHGGEPGLRIVACLGNVRARDCAFVGWEGVEDCDTSGEGRGGAGARVEGSLRVAFTDCALIGGRGDWRTDLSGCIACHGGDGGHGLDALDSAVTIHGGELLGGLGGDLGLSGGDGGAGARLHGLGLYAAGASFRGGKGGDACDFIAPIPGNGGHGVHLSGGAGARFLDCELEGGAPGVDRTFGMVGHPGSPSLGGIQVFLDGSARHVSGAWLAPDAAELRVGVRGEPGDQAYLLVSDAPDWNYEAHASGMRLVAQSGFIGARALGVVPAGGYLSVATRLPALPPGASHARRYLQVLARDASGAYFLGGSVSLSVLRSGSAPDCDGDGANDLLGLLAGDDVDCNGNLATDACELAGGASADCNSNGVPDECEIARGTSDDLDTDGVPDECQGLGQTFHVDAAAAPGGDGSAGLPFRIIAEGVAAATAGDTVLLADGTYTGPGNVGVNLGNQAIRLRSANGPAFCVVDCQGSARAFTVPTNFGDQLRVEGITVRDGSAAISGGAMYVGVASPTIRDCVFQDCTAPRGGAVHLDGASPRLERCEFRGNQGTWGGALHSDYAAPLILECSFVANVALDSGGAWFLRMPAEGERALIERCVLLENSADDGGAIAFRSAQSFPETERPLLLDQCLFAGNFATDGGGVHVSSPFSVVPALVRASSCTFASNVASGGGGALFASGNVALELANGVLWSNAAPTGPAVALSGLESSTAVRFTDVEDGQAAIATGAGTLEWGPGNLELDPLFVDPVGPDGDPLAFEDNDYRLAAPSPCVDAAEQASLMLDVLDLDFDGAAAEPVPVDLGGLMRRVDDQGAVDAGDGLPPLADLGVYERP